MEVEIQGDMPPVALQIQKDSPLSALQKVPDHQVLKHRDNGGFLKLLDVLLPVYIQNLDPTYSPQYGYVISLSICKKLPHIRL